MRSLLTALLLFLVVPSCLVAQKSEADLRARLIQKPLYLRGQWRGDKLAFDGLGHLTGTSAPVTFTLAGVDIQFVKLTAKELVLNGQRVGLEFNQDMPVRVDLGVRNGWGGADPEKMIIRIQTPADGDFTAALDAIFADKLADLVPQLPPYWRTFAQRNFLPQGTSAASMGDSAQVAKAGPGQPAGMVKPFRAGGSVSSPRLLTKVDPSFDEAARALKYSGIVLVNLIVDTKGMPANVHILHPVGLGLDEMAINAVSQYTFAPAIENGSPVAVELNVEVNFQIF